jgi:hypothetical protein
MIWLALTAWAAPDDLVHQGRVIDASGAPVSGEHDLTFTFYSPADAVLDTVVVNDVALQDGYYSVRFPTSASFGGTTEVRVGVRVDAATEGARTPLGAVPRARYAVSAGTAATAQSIPVLGATTGACAPAGAIGWDSVADSLKVCSDGLVWLTVGGVRTVLNVGGVRRWSDNSAAASCAAYRNPPSGYSYAGETGSGTYLIAPLGTSFQVFCDMDYDGGGWTKVMAFGPTGATDMGTTSAVNPDGTWTTQARGTAVGKVSNAEWTALRGAGTELMTRVQNPSDAKLLGNGVGYLKWTALGGTTWPTWGTSYRPTNWRFDCDKTGDGVTDQSVTQTTATDALCGHGTYWIHDHHGGVQCFGTTTVQMTTNLHFCGLANGTTSDGSVTGTHSLYLR